MDSKKQKIQKTQNLKALAHKHLPELLAQFIPDGIVSDKLLISTCPIHDGDNESAFNINIDPDDQYCGRWFCNTQKCHLEYSNDVFGFLTAKLGSFSRAEKYVKEALGNPDCNGKVVAQVDQVTRFLTRKKSKTTVRMNRKNIRKSLLIPSMYYIERGFKPETLDHFDVGLCLTSGTQMYRRVVFPVYDIDDEHMVGCVGRDVTGQAKFKWVNSKGFNKAQYLYNYAKAIKSPNAGTLILCEGQGDVMRLHEAGFDNAVGLFGSSISDGQQRLLEESGALSLLLALDPDKAGEGGMDKIVEKCGMLFNIERVKLPDERDVGDLSIDEIRVALSN